MSSYTHTLYMFYTFSILLGKNDESKMVLMSVRGHLEMGETQDLTSFLLNLTRVIKGYSRITMVGDSPDARTCVIRLKTDCKIYYHIKVD